MIQKLGLVKVICQITERHPQTGLPIVMKVLPNTYGNDVRDYVTLWGAAFVFEPQQPPVAVEPKDDEGACE